MAHDDNRQSDTDIDSADIMNDEDLMQSETDEDTDLLDETSEGESTRRKGGRSSGISDNSADDEDEMDWEEN